MFDFFNKKEKSSSAELGQLIRLVDIALNKAEEEFFETGNYSKGMKYLQQANKLYDQWGYDFDTECRINELCFLYLRRN